MKIQGIVSDVRQHIEVAGRNYQGAFKAYVEAQRKALAVVTSGGTSLANTEIGAAKNIFSSARASFEKARQDGLRQMARQPQHYLPKSRAQLIAAYKSSIDLLVKTSGELTEVVSTGYRDVIGQLTGATEKTVEKPAEPAPTARKTASRRQASTTKAQGKPTKTAGTNTAAQSKTTSTKSASAKRSTTRKAAATKTTAAKKTQAATGTTTAAKKSATTTTRKRAPQKKTTASDTTSTDAGS